MYTNQKQFVIVTILSLLHLDGGAVRAQSAAGSSVSASESDVCLQDVRCIELCESARGLSESRKYDAALAVYRSAYERSKAPWLLLNIGRMHQKAGRLLQAMSTYQRLLDDPAVRRDPEAEKRAREFLLQARQEAAARDVRPTIATATTPPPQLARVAPLHKRWWLWTVVGVVAAGTAAGVAGGVLAARDGEPPPSQLGTARTFTITISR
jgi:hypothetical protein